MKRKRAFFLRPDQIRPLAINLGGCFATDRITYDGAPVGYMYREKPDFDGDSGWRFVAGDESEEYMSDAKNLHIYDLNIIANHSPDIIPHLSAPVGSAFLRDGGGKLREDGCQ